MPYLPSRVARPRASSGSPRRMEPHGPSSIRFSPVRMSLVRIRSRSLKTRRISRSSSTPMLGLAPRFAVASVSAVARAVLGQSPPAVSATATRDSQTSARRSVTPSGIAGQPLSSGLMAAAQFANRSCSFSASGPLTRGRHGSTGSVGALLRILTTIDRDMMVSGRSSRPAKATAQYAGSSSVSTILPRMTQRPATAPLRWPALITPRISSCSLAFGPNRVSHSSYRTVGRPTGSATRRNR
ncbi:Uncharacterised protein [Mycobacterium tuberculosis]|nr:Uncharacterised protein [Mycobacterium tuberculosis]